MRFSLFLIPLILLVAGIGHPLLAEDAVAAEKGEGDKMAAVEPYEVRYPCIVDEGDYYQVWTYWFRGDITTLEPSQKQWMNVRKGSVVAYTVEWYDDAVPGNDPDVHYYDSKIRNPKGPRNSRFLINLYLEGGHVVQAGAITMPTEKIRGDELKLLGLYLKDPKVQQSLHTLLSEPRK